MKRFLPFLLIGVVSAAGCELTEVETQEAVDQVIAEVWVYVGEESTTARALLHRTFTTNQTPPRGDIVIRRPADGAQVALGLAPLEDCTFEDQPDRAVGSCYTASDADLSFIKPGDSLAIHLDLGEDGTLTGATTAPEDFDLLQPAVFADEDIPICRIEPLTNVQFMWTSAAGTWAYLSETLIQGLEEIVPDSSVADLLLTGLSLSASDTTIIYPGNYGVFERFDLNADVALLLQEGLPEGTRARVELLAGDRNATNWLRQGSFNPSGLVRIPSLQGKGTGVFSVNLIRSFAMVSAVAGSPDAKDSEGDELPSCGPPLAP